MNKFYIFFLIKAKGFYYSCFVLNQLLMSHKVFDDTVPLVVMVGTALLLFNQIMILE